MNLIEILVNVDKGTELYSPLFKEPLTFLQIDSSSTLPIRCLTKEGLVIGFSKEGYYAYIPASLTCVLFPTSEMTWDNIIYIKEEDLLVCTDEDCNVQYFFAKETGFYNTNYSIPCHCGISTNGSIFDTGEYYISAKGTSDDLKEFKKVLTKYNCYLEGYSINRKGSKKSDFSSLKPFNKVLVRDSTMQKWCGDFFQYMEGNSFVCTSAAWAYCIPYNYDTKHLVGTSMPAPEYYKK